MENELTIQENEQLEHCEQIISNGIKTFIETGTALLLIRDNKLYRKEYPTFEEYCKERWSMSKTNANRIISAIEITRNLTPTGVIPETERQLRPLTSLEPEQQKELWTKAIETAPNGKITAAHVQNIVDDYKRPHVANNSGNNEWYTPSGYIEAARNVMKEIDLDPASSTAANKVIKALQYYTINTDGLNHDWFGRVWLNPPYATDLIWQFIRKLEYHFQCSDVHEAIVLVNNATDTKWFQSLGKLATKICFPSGRIRFVRPEGNIGAPLQGQAIFYLGPNYKEFIHEFEPFGLIR